MKSTILFTGGGTAGHVTPNLALIDRLLAEGWQVHYAGTADGIEKKLLADKSEVTYHTISSGKFRRYFSLKNFTDPFRVIKGVFQCKKIVKQVKPDVVFSKGGFVSVPVVMGAKKKAPVIVHESDYTPGLANRIASRYADQVCVTFEDTLQHVKGKGVFTGTPIRPALYAGDVGRGYAFTGLKKGKPVLLVMGGSLGAQAVNQALRESLPVLLNEFNVVHLCGKGKLDESCNALPGYCQYEYITDELPDLFAMSDIVLSRAGANAVFELLALKKPSVLVPLPLSASRGDQILNAGYFQKKGYAVTLEQEKLTKETLCEAVKDLYARREEFHAAMDKEPNTDGTQAVLNVIKKAAKR